VVQWLIIIQDPKTTNTVRAHIESAGNMAAATVNKERWSLAGATALLTGGSKGIGHAIVEERVFFFFLKDICPHSLTYWIRIEKCANTHLKADSH